MKSVVEIEFEVDGKEVKLNKIGSPTDLIRIREELNKYGININFYCFCG